jgi:hypothetical protein
VTKITKIRENILRNRVEIPGKLVVERRVGQLTGK